MYVKSFTVPPTVKSFSAPEFVQLCCRFGCRLRINSRQGEYDAKSIMGMLSVNPFEGPLTIRADGPDEEEAVHAILAFFDAAADD